MERAFGKPGVLTVTYVGAAGRKLMRQDIYVAPNPNFTGEFDLMSNNGNSSYPALQDPIQPSSFRFQSGLQALFSYAWAHSSRQRFIRLLFRQCLSQLLAACREERRALRLTISFAHLLRCGFL